MAWAELLAVMTMIAVASLERALCSPGVLAVGKHLICEVPQAQLAWSGVVPLHSLKWFSQRTTEL